MTLPPPPPPQPQPRPRPRPELSPRRRAFFAAAIAYGLILVFTLTGWLIGPLVPCSGGFCQIGRAIEGGVSGLVVALGLTAFLAHRLRLRAWFVPVIVVLAAGCLALFTVLGEPVGSVFLIILVFAPIIAALTASGLPRRSQAIAFGALALAIALTVGFSLMATRLEDQRHHKQRADNFRATQIPLYAPTASSDAEIRLTSADAEFVIYDLRTPSHTGWLRVVLRPAGEPNNCSGANVVDQGDGISTIGTTDIWTVCRDLPDAVAELSPDGPGDWEGQEMVDIARQLAPADAQWFIDRGR